MILLAYMFRLRIFAFLLLTFLLSLFVYNFQSKTASAADTVKATLVRTIDTSKWSPPSPDPAGIAYHGGRLVISDSEVEEMTIYKGKNFYEASLDGKLSATADTTSFSKEPTGVAVNPSNGHYFFSDDNKKRVYEVDPGSDNKVGTSDDKVSSFSTSAFNSTDPEGIAYGGGKLYIADGVGTEVYVVNPDGGGATHFDVGGFGIQDPEGVEYNPDNGTLFVLGKNDMVAEVTTQGNLVRKIDISASGARKPAGITYAPATNKSGKNLYVVDRGVDNNRNPDENDGKIYELSFSSSAINPTPTPAPTSPSTPTAAPSKTPTPTAPVTPTPTPFSGDTLIFTPTDDASIFQRSPNNNYNSRTSLEVDGSPVKNFLIKFTVTGIGTQPVISAKLKLYNINASASGGNFYRVVDTSWNEGTVTWNTAPVVSGDIIAALGKVIKNNWYDVDVTPYITGDGTYSFRITSSSGNGADYTSKEGSASLAPYLEVAL